MSDTGKTARLKGTRVRKPPPRWRRYLVQAELELPAPDSTGRPVVGGTSEAFDGESDDDETDLRWWRSQAAVLGLAIACLGLLVVAVFAVHRAHLDRESARVATARAQTLTLRAIDSERALRIAPNPRSWSARPDASIVWPEPPQLLELYLPVGYARRPAYALVVDKVDHGRVMVIERLSPDSNGDLRVGINSSAFGPGEYRMRLQGYDWRGERQDLGWVRLEVERPR